MDSKETTAASEKASGAAACGRYAATPCSALSKRPETLPEKFDVFVGDRDAHDAPPEVVKENDARLRSFIRIACGIGYRVIVWYSERERRTYYSFLKQNTPDEPRKSAPSGVLKGGGE